MGRLILSMALDGAEYHIMFNVEALNNPDCEGCVQYPVGRFFYPRGTNS